MVSPNRWTSSRTSIMLKQRQVQARASDWSDEERPCSVLRSAPAQWSAYNHLLAAELGATVCRPAEVTSRPSEADTRPHLAHVSTSGDIAHVSTGVNRYNTRVNKWRFSTRVNNYIGTARVQHILYSTLSTMLIRRQQFPCQKLPKLSTVREAGLNQHKWQLDGRNNIQTMTKSSKFWFCVLRPGSIWLETLWKL